MQCCSSRSVHYGSHDGDDRFSALAAAAPHPLPVVRSQATSVYVGGRVPDRLRDKLDTRAAKYRFASRSAALRALIECSAQIDPSS